MKPNEDTVIQPLLFPKRDICDEKALYFHTKNKNIMQDEKDCLVFRTKDEVDFSSYFNAFSVKKWDLYCGIKDIALSLDVCGAFVVTLLAYANQSAEILDEVSIDTEDKRRKIDFLYPKREDSILYAFRITALQENAVLYGGSYVTKTKVRNRIHIGIIFCTYHREQYMLRNMRRLLADKDRSCNTHMDIIVVDNGNTLLASGEEIWHSEDVSVIGNPNYGGSGGYTRGLIELIRRQKEHTYTHALLMDDDIILDPRVIDRLYRFLQMVNPAYQNRVVGGAMLRTDISYIQSECGGKFLDMEVTSCHAGWDMRRLISCIENEKNNRADYNAWWFCAIPMQYIRADHLPLPLFVRYDDVEFGMRIGREPLLLNGIAVWHESFENKYSSTMRYYDTRNQLITDAVCDCRYDKWRLLHNVFRMSVLDALFFRYDTADLILQGVFDFLKGPEWLLQKDPERLHGVLSQKGYHLKDDVYQLTHDERDVLSHRDRKDKSRMHRLIRYVTINGMLLPARKSGITELYDARLIDFYRKKEVLHYNSNAHKGFVTQRSLGRLMKCVVEYVYLFICVLLFYDCAVRRYKRAHAKMTGLDFWNQYLNT